MCQEEEAVIDKKFIHKGVLHKLAQSGGSIKFNRFGIRVAYDPDNPTKPFVEIQLFAIPMDVAYKGKINPYIARNAKKDKLEKEKQKEFKIEEEETIYM